MSTRGDHASPSDTPRPTANPTTLPLKPNRSLARTVTAPPLRRPPGAGKIGRRRVFRGRPLASHHAQRRDETKFWQTLIWSVNKKANTVISEIPVEIVCTLDELIQAVAKTFGESKSRWWFRGHADSSWKLLPKIQRGYDVLTERYLANLFYQGAKLRHASFPHDDDYAGWLALMQHYGLPTRLLDWSNSALIAAYFATKYDSDMSRKTEGDAAVWMLQPETLNATQGYESVFPSLNAESLASLVHGAFKEPRTKPSHDVLAAVPVNQDLRMVMQQGTFTIHANDMALEDHLGCHSWLRKLLIPAESVRRIRLSLDVLGMRLSDVFPDLGHLAIDLAKMDGPKPFPAH
jgi:hypothetical protein